MVSISDFVKTSSFFRICVVIGVHSFAGPPKISLLIHWGSVGGGFLGATETINN